jgi:translation initiation factor IF-3
MYPISPDCQAAMGKCHNIKYYLDTLVGFIVDTCIHFLYFMEVFYIAKNGNNNHRDGLVNEYIRATELFVIGPNGEQLGIKSKADALTLAGYAGFDLVVVNAGANPPVCKLMDYNKFHYEKKKKEKEASKKQRINSLELKEFRLSPNIDVHDFETKKNNVIKCLEKGNKIKITIRFKGREMAHSEIGKNVMIRFAESLNTLADLESEPKMDGRTMIMLLTPKNK